MGGRVGFERDGGSWPGYSMKGSGLREHWFSNVPVHRNPCGVVRHTEAWVLPPETVSDADCSLGIESFNSFPGDSNM